MKGRRMVPVWLVVILCVNCLFLGAWICYLLLSRYLAKAFDDG